MRAPGDGPRPDSPRQRRTQPSRALPYNSPTHDTAYNARRDAYLSKRDVAPPANPYPCPLSHAYACGYRDSFLKGSRYLRWHHLENATTPPEFAGGAVEAAWTHGHRDGAEAAYDLHLDWLIEC